MIQRASSAAGDLLGESYGQLVYSLLEACKRGHVGMYLARVLLERCLPETRPTPVTLPIINTAHDLVEADRRLSAANVGAISHRESRHGAGVHPGHLGDPQAGAAGRASDGCDRPSSPCNVELKRIRQRAGVA